MPDIYGYPSKTGHMFLKSSFYAGPSGYSTIVMERDPAKHRETKRLMAYGFSSKELQAQEPILKTNLGLLTHQIETQGGFDKNGVSLNKVRPWPTKSQPQNSLYDAAVAGLCF